MVRLSKQPAQDVGKPAAARRYGFIAQERVQIVGECSSRLIPQFRRLLQAPQRDHF